MEFDTLGNKPPYIKKYQRIFTHILRGDSFIGDNVNERYGIQSRNNTFYDGLNKQENKILYSNTLTIETDRNNISNTKYNLLTGRNFNIHKNIKKNDFKKTINNNLKYQSKNPETLSKNLLKKENTIRSFKTFIKNTEKRFSNYEYHPLSNHFANHNRSRNLSGNIFIEKLYSALPEYMNLTTRGQSFLNNNNIKGQFKSLKNRLNHL